LGCRSIGAIEVGLPSKKEPNAGKTKPGAAAKVVFVTDSSIFGRIHSAA
jgi:hypothetical protein